MKNYLDATSKAIASFYGHQKLQQEYEKKMADVWAGMDVLNQAALAGIDLSNSQREYCVPTVTTCPDI